MPKRKNNAKVVNHLVNALRHICNSDYLYARDKLGDVVRNYDISLVNRNIINQVIKHLKREVK